MNRFKRGLPGRSRKIDPAARRRHQVENRAVNREEGTQALAAEPADVAAMIADLEDSVESSLMKCPLCGEPLFPSQKTKMIEMNKQKVLMHLDC